MKIKKDIKYTDTSYFWIPTYYNKELDLYFCEPESKEFVSKFYQWKYWNEFSRENVSLLGNYIKNILSYLNIPDSYNYKNIQILLQQGYLNKNSKILEIGCWEWININYLSKKWFNISGIEMDITNVNSINNRNWKNIVIQWNYEDKHIDEKFDIIYLRHVLEHFIDIEKVIQKLKENLTDDWIIFIDVPYSDDKNTLNWSINLHPHIYHFTKKSLKLMFEINWLTQIFQTNHQRKNTEISKYKVLNQLYHVFIRIFFISAICNNTSSKVKNEKPHDLICIFKKS